MGATSGNRPTSVVKLVLGLGGMGRWREAAACVSLGVFLCGDPDDIIVDAMPGAMPAFLVLTTSFLRGIPRSTAQPRCLAMLVCWFAMSGTSWLVLASISASNCICDVRDVRPERLSQYPSHGSMLKPMGATQSLPVPRLSLFVRKVRSTNNSGNNISTIHPSPN